MKLLAKLCKNCAARDGLLGQIFSNLVLLVQIYINVQVLYLFYLFLLKRSTITETEAKLYFCYCWLLSNWFKFVLKRGILGVWGLAPWTKIENLEYNEHFYSTFSAFSEHIQINNISKQGFEKGNILGAYPLDKMETGEQGAFIEPIFILLLN